MCGEGRDERLEIGYKLKIGMSIGLNKISLTAQLSSLYNDDSSNDG